MSRPRDIRNDIGERLLRTGAFSSVWLTGPPEDVGRSAGDVCAAALPPADGDEETRWDGDEHEGSEVKERLTATILARHNDPQLCIEKAEELLQHLRNAVNGRSLAGLTVPGYTRVGPWKYQRFRAPEQRISVAIRYRYLLEGPGRADETP